MEETLRMTHLSRSAAVHYPTVAQRAAYYLELTKPRILVMILLTVVISMVAAGGPKDLWVMLHACLGTGMVAASASVLNQWAERDRDRIMLRTSRRPLPTGRVAASEAAWMGWLLAIVGLAYLAAFVNLATMYGGLATWFLYVWVYTPLKMHSWTNTLVGTLPGALPVWMGWTAADGSLSDWRAWVLLGVLVAWQLPHFMSIAWLYREQYASAGYRMITITDPSGQGAAWHAMLGAIALVPLAVLAVPPTSVLAGGLCVAAVGLAIWQIGVAWRFSRQPDAITARRMLRASLLYLPLTMFFILLHSLLA